MGFAGFAAEDPVGVEVGVLLWLRKWGDRRWDAEEKRLLSILGGLRVLDLVAVLVL